MKNRIRKIMAVLLTLTLMSADVGTIAESAIHTLTLPKALQIIEEEAFYGDTSIEKVVVPDGTTEIHARAFAQSTLKEINLPGSLTFIDDTAFEGLTDLTVTAREGSWAYDWALSKGYISPANLNLENIEVDCGEIAVRNGEVYWENISGHRQSSDVSGIEADGEWRLESIDEWIAIISEETDGGTQSSGVEFEENRTGASRTGKIDVVCGSTIRTITVVQLPYLEARLSAPAVLARDGVWETYYDEELDEYVDVKDGNYPILDFEDIKTIWDAVDGISADNYAMWFEPYYAEDQCYELFSEGTDTVSGTVPKCHLEPGSNELTFLYTCIYDEEHDYYYAGTQYAFYISGEGLDDYSICFNYDFQVNEIISAEITGYYGEETELVIPDTLLDYPVTRINYWAFSGNTRITSVVIPNSVEDISGEAFLDCTNLTSVTVPESVEWIDNDAFSGCTNLEHFYVVEGSYAYDWAVKHNFLPEIAVTPTPIPEPSEITENGVVYYLNNGTATVTDYVGSSTSVEIPAQVRGYPVTEIGNNAFEDCYNMKSINIPDGVTGIGDCAFKSCYSLANFNIPEGVIQIGMETFACCSSLTSIDIPDSVTTIGAGAFERCANLRSITLPDSLTQILYDTFAGCWLLTSLSIPANVTNIDSGAFKGCENLKSIEASENNPSYFSINGVLYKKENRWESGGGLICYPPKKEGSTYEVPYGIDYIEDFAFSCCVALTSIQLPDTIKWIGRGAFDSCSNLTSINIPDEVQIIDSMIFADCRALTDISLPSTIDSIRESAFWNCTGLDSITIPKNVKYIGDDAFSRCGPDFVIYGYTGSCAETYASQNGLRFVSIGEAIYSDFEYKIENGEAIITGYTGQDEKITIPEKLGNYAVTAIADDAFVDKALSFYGITSVTIPEGIKSIGDRAFMYCELTELILPDSLESIGDSAFYSVKISAVSIPANVRYIGKHAFGYCKSMTEFEVTDGNNSYISVDGVLFSDDMSKLICYPYAKEGKTYCVPEGVTVIGDYAFNENSKLESITIAESVKTIRRGAFEGCYALRSVSLPEGVETIGERAFAGSGLNNVYIPASVTELGNQTFAEIYQMESIEVAEDNPAYISLENKLFTKDMRKLIRASGTITNRYEIPNGVTTICDYAFYSSSHTEIIIPDSVTSIGIGAFKSADYITSIEIPSGITHISDHAFDNCYRLSNISIPEGVTSIGEAAFSRCSALSTVDFPDTVTSIGKDAFCGCSSLQNVDIPDGISSIPSGTFCFCDCLSSVSIPLSVTSIGASAFSDCKSLESIVLSDSIVSIAGGAFSGCDNLSTVKLGSGIMDIGSYAFGDCPKLTEIEIPYGMEFLNFYAFMGCSNLSKIVIPPSVKGIEGSFKSSENFRLDGITIYGEPGSYAEFYAKENNYAFEDIEDITASIVSVVPSATTAYTNVGINFYISTANATIIKLIADNTWEFEYPATNDETIINRAFSLAGERMIQFSASNGDGLWSTPSEPIIMHIMSEEECSGIVIDNPVSDGIVLNNTQIFTWAPALTGVEIDHYNASLYIMKDENWEQVGSTIDTGTSASVSFDTLLLQSGKYMLAVEMIPSGSQNAAATGKLFFDYRTVPAFSLASIDNEGLPGSSAIVKWNAPVWAADGSQKPDKYIIWVYGPGIETGHTIEVSGSVNECEITSDVLALSGSYVVDVYAILGEGNQWQQTVADGYNGFKLAERMITIDNKAGPYLATDELHVTGKATGGIRYVRAQLEKNGGPDVVPLVGVDGEAQDFFVVEVDAQTNEYYVKLEPADAMSLDDSNAITVYGYATREEAEEGKNYLKTSFLVLNVTGSTIYSRSIKSNLKTTYGYTWRYVNEQLHVEVVGNRAMESLSVTAGGNAVAQISSEDIANYRRKLTSDCFSFSSYGVYNVVISVDGTTRTEHVYVVDGQTAEVAYVLSDNAVLMSLPNEGKQMATITYNEQVQVLGSYGDKMKLVRYSGQTGFVDTDKYELSSSMDLAVHWSLTVENATDPTLTVSATNTGAIIGNSFVLLIGTDDKDKTIRYPNCTMTLSSVESANSWSWNLSKDLGLEKGHVYYFGVAQGHGLSQKTVEYPYGISATIISPSHGELLDFFTSGQLSIEWGKTTGATSYTVELLTGNEVIYRNTVSLLSGDDYTENCIIRPETAGWIRSFTDAEKQNNTNVRIRITANIP